MNHLIIYGKDFTSEDKDFIIKVLSYTAIPLGMVKFVDINAVDSFLPSKLNFCFNNTHGIVARSVCSNEGYKDKEKLYMSRQQNKRTIGSSKSCVDLIFHPPQKKNSLPPINNTHLQIWKQQDNKR